MFLAKPEVYRFDFSKPPLGENPVLVIALAILAVSTVSLPFVLKKNFSPKRLPNKTRQFCKFGSSKN